MASLTRAAPPILLGIMLCSGGILMAGRKSDQGKTAQSAHVGRFSGSPSGYVGRLILELNPDGTFWLRNIVSVHLPPAELESLKGKISWTGDTGCLSPTPATIERCMTVEGPDVLQITQKQGQARVRLTRIVETPEP